MATPDTAVVAAAQTLIDRGAVLVLTRGKRTPDFLWSRPDGSTKGSDRDRVIRLTGSGESRPHFTAEEAAGWLAKPGKREVGVLVSTVDDGLCVVDFDKGVESASALAGLMGDPLAITTSTGGTGKHAWFRWPADSKGVFTRKTGLWLPGVAGKLEAVKADVIFSNGLVCEGAEGLVQVASALADAGDNAGRMEEGVWQVLDAIFRNDSQMRAAFEELSAMKGDRHPSLMRAAGKAVQGNFRQWGPDGFLSRLLVAAALPLFPADRAGEVRRGVHHVTSNAKAEWDNLFKGLRKVGMPAPATRAVADRIMLPGKPSMTTVALAFDQLGWKFCRDTLRNERMIDRGHGWEILTGDTLTKVRGHLARVCFHAAEGGAPIPFEMKDNTSFLRPVVLEACDANERNPLTEWMGDCKRKAINAGGLDGKGHLLDTWLADLFDIRLSGTFTEDALRWISRRLVCASVARIIRPGTAWPRMVILQGPQGIGKSELVKHMLPPDLRRDYHTDELHFGQRESQMIYAVKGKLWVECSEMRGRAKDIGDMRSFITRTVDGSGERLAYRYDVEGHPRTCVIVGTANHHDCVPADEHGTRRYFVVPLAGTKAPSPQQSGAWVQDVMGDYRDLLYGLAYLALEEDEQFTGEWGRMLIDEAGLSDVFRAAAESQQQVDELEAPIRRFVDDWELHCEELGGYFHGQELAEACGLVGLAAGQARYERWSAKSNIVKAQVKRILSGKGFGLVYTTRWVGWDGMEQVCGWWHADPAEGEIPGKDHEWADTVRRRFLLGITPPEELIKERINAGGAKEDDGSHRDAPPPPPSLVKVQGGKNPKPPF